MNKNELAKWLKIMIKQNKILANEPGIHEVSEAYYDGKIAAYEAVLRKIIDKPKAEN